MPVEFNNVGILDDQGNRIGGAAAPIRNDPTGTTTQPVSGTVTAAPSTDVSTSASLTALNQTLVLTVGSGQTSWSVDLRGTFSAASGITFQGSVDGTNFKNVALRRVDDTSGSLLSSVAGGATYILRGSCAAFSKVQVLVSAFQAGDSITATLRAGAGAEAFFLESGLPASGATIGATVGTGSPGSAVGGVLSTQHPDVSASAALTSGASTVTIALVGAHTVSVQIAAGTLAATIVPQFSMDGGTSYKIGWFKDPVTRVLTQSVVFTNPNAATSLELLVPSGTSHARVAVSAFTSGAANCAVRGSQARPSEALAFLFDGTGAGPVGVAPANTAATTGQAALVVAPSPNSTIGIGAISVNGINSFSPDPHADNAGLTSLMADASGNLEVRGQVLSDEGSFRDDFSGSSLTTALSGTLAFTNGSLNVVGTGTFFTAEVSTDYYIKKTADSETLYVRVASITDDTHLVLTSNYAGTTASGVTAVRSNWITSTPAGGSITVSNSEVLLAPGTASGAVVQISRQGDYPPYTQNFRLRITQRIANQTAIFGYCDNPASISKQAVVVYDGTSGGTLKFRTSSSSAAADIQETVVSLAQGVDTSSTQMLQIDLSPNIAVLSVNGTIAASHQNHLPGPYDQMVLFAQVTNAAVVTATTLAIDALFFANLDQLQVANAFIGEPLRVQIVTAATSNAGFSFGDVTLAANAFAAVRRTTYTEQAANAQRSVVSTSASDTAAGTGARTVKLTYLDVTGIGPSTETVTMNGTTAVNTVTTTFCFSERMDILTVGTALAAVGIINLKAATAGGGATIWSIGAGDTQTFGCHHYVPINKTCYVTDINANHNGTTVGSGAVFVLRALPSTTANAVEKQISDFHRLYGQSSTVPRSFATPIQVTGPARITAYAAPETTSSTVYRCSFDYSDQ